MVAKLATSLVLAGRVALGIAATGFIVVTELGHGHPHSPSFSGLTFPNMRAWLTRFATTTGTGPTTITSMLDPVVAARNVIAFYKFDKSDLPKPCRFDFGFADSVETDVSESWSSFPRSEEPCNQSAQDIASISNHDLSETCKCQQLSHKRPTRGHYGTLASVISARVPYHMGQWCIEKAAPGNDGAAYAGGATGVDATSGRSSISTAGQRCLALTRWPTACLSASGAVRKMVAMARS